VTVPGTFDGVTVAVNTTSACPYAAGFAEDEIEVVVASGLIVSDRGAEVTGKSFASPLYVATIEFGPVYRFTLVAVTVAVPPLTATVPRLIRESINVTVPVAVDGVTVAVMVTGCPNTPGLGDAVTVTVDAAAVGDWPNRILTVLS
jgi:hypothetical protein